MLGPFDERYQLPSWPPVTFNRDLLNLLMGDVADRLAAREALEASFEALIAQGTQASLDYIQATIAPQIASLQETITLAQDQIDTIVHDGVAPDSSKLGGQLPAWYAPKASPAFTGSPTAPTATFGTATSQLATTAFVSAAIAALVGGASSALDTLKEIEDKLAAEDSALAAMLSTLTTKATITYVDTALALKQDIASRGILSGFRNKIINGDFDIWQRRTTFTITAGANAYVADRWLITNLTNQPVTIDRTAFNLGQTEVPGEPQWFLKASFATAPTSGDLYVAQKIEGVRTLAGGKATATTYMTGGSADAYQLYAEQYFGVSGSAAVKIVAKAGNLDTAGFSKVQGAVDLPSIAGKTINGTDCLTFVHMITPRSATAYKIAHASIVKGDATLEANPYEPRHIQQELFLCQRYGRLFGQGMIGRWDNSSTTELFVGGILPFRVTPSLSLVASTATMYRIGLESFIATGLSIAGGEFSNGGGMVYLQKTGGGSPTGGELSALASNIIFGDAEI